MMIKDLHFNTEWAQLPGDHPQWYLDAYPLMYLSASETLQWPATIDDFAAEVGMEGRIRQTNIYVHIPFCLQPCDYCVLHKRVYRQELGQTYLKSLRAEMELMAGSNLISDVECRCVSFGGGTPTTLPAKELVDLFKSFPRLFPCTDDFQCSLEGSTSTCNKPYFHTLLEGGIRRISFGIQSFDAKQRWYLGCADATEKAKKAVMEARAAGFPNINIDMLYGLPGQTVSDLEKDLEEALSLNLECYTIYPLAVYPQSKLYSRIKRGDVPATPGPPVLNDMLDCIAERMKRAGYLRSWLNQYIRSDKYLPPGGLKPGNYLAFGSGAFGTLHYWSYLNDLDIASYMKAVSQGFLPFSRRNPISTVQWALRKFYDAFLQLKVNWREFTLVERKILRRLLAKYSTLGLWDNEDEALTPTARGRHFADGFIQALLFDSINLELHLKAK